MSDYAGARPESFVWLDQPDHLVAVLDIKPDGTGCMRTCCGMAELSAEDLGRLRAFLGAGQSRDGRVALTPEEAGRTS